MTVKNIVLFLALLISTTWSILEAKYLDIGGASKSVEKNLRKPASNDGEWNGIFKQHAGWNEILKDYWTDPRFQKLESSLNEQASKCQSLREKSAQAQCINNIEWMILKDGLGQYKLFLNSELAPDLVLARDKMTIGDCDLYWSDKECAGKLIDSVFSESIKSLWKERFNLNFPNLHSEEIIFKEFNKYQKSLVSLCQLSFKEDEKERCAKHVEFALSHALTNYWSEVIVAKNHGEILKLFKNNLNACFDAPFSNLGSEESWQRLYNFELSEYSIIVTDCLQQGAKQLLYYRTLSRLTENLNTLSAQLRLIPMPSVPDLQKLNDLSDVIYESVLAQTPYNVMKDETSFEAIKNAFEKNMLTFAQDYALDYFLINFDEQKFRYLLSDVGIGGAFVLGTTDLLLVKGKIREHLKGSQLIGRAKISGEKRYFKQILLDNFSVMELQLKQLEVPALNRELMSAGFDENDLKDAGDLIDNYESWAKVVLSKLTGIKEIKINGDCFNRKETLNYNVLKCLRQDLETAHSLETITSIQRILAMNFPPQSREYRSMGAEASMLPACYREVSRFMPLNLQWQQIQNCGKIALFDLDHNIDRAIAFSYTPMILQQDWQKIDENLNYCYGMSLMETKVADVNLMFSTNKKSHKGKLQLLDFFNDGPANFESSPEDLVSFKANKDKLRIILKSDLNTWPGIKTAQCREATQKLTFLSFQEFIVMNFSGELKRNLQNNKGESVEFILRSLFNVEFMDLLMSVPEIPGVNKYVTRTKVLNALSNTISKLSGFMQKGFVFDREKMKTELVVLRGQMIEFLEFVKSEKRLVEMTEMKDFFMESSLPEFLAVSFLSELLHEKFVIYLESKKTDALSRLVHEYPSYGQAKKQFEFQQKRQELLAKFKSWESLGDRLLMAHDFRRVMNINSEDSKDLMIYLKRKMIPEIVLDGELSPSTEKDFVRLASEIFVKDTSHDGIVGILAREYLQKLLDDKKSDYWFFSSKDSWWITKKFLNKKEAFDWDALAQTPTGQEVLDFYVRYLFFPDFMGDNLTVETKKSLEETFKSKLESISKKMR